MAGRRRHSGLVLLLIAWWAFGNLYEAVVVLPLLWRLPPGSLPAAAEPGSPVLYFVPAGVALLVSVWWLVARVADAGSPGAVRPVATAAGLVTAAMVVTVPLVVLVNPVFRDAAASVGELHAAVVYWEIANAVRLLAAAGAAAILTRWRGRSVTG